jgi:hypothetical protein
MYKGAALFLMIFLAINQQTRTFISEAIGRVPENFDSWGANSYVILGGLAAAALISLLMVKFAPRRADTANPVTKYKKHIRYEE